MNQQEGQQKTAKRQKNLLTFFHISGLWTFLL